MRHIGSNRMSLQWRGRHRHHRRHLNRTCRLGSIRGVSATAFGVFGAFRNNELLKEAGVTPMERAKDVERLLARFLNAHVNAFGAWPLRRWFW